MEIRSGWGVGPFPFGLTEADLIERLGRPERLYTTESGARRWQYFGPQIEFALEPENGDRFGWAEVYNPDATLIGVRVIGAVADTVLERVVVTLGEQPEGEEYGWGESYFFPRNWMELQVRFGRVRSVNFGVWYDEADEPLWPRVDPRSESATRTK